MNVAILQQSHTVIIITPGKTKNDQHSPTISTDYTENVDIEYQNKVLARRIYSGIQCRHSPCTLLVICRFSWTNNL